MIEILRSKIHRATVTDANIDYVGSITISRKLMEASNLFEFQKVLVVDINNGQRLETYVIPGEDDKTICLNGAAARLVSVGDKVIIMSFEYIDECKAKGYEPTIVLVDNENNICNHS